MANPEAALRAGGFSFTEDQREPRAGWLSFTIVAVLHLVGLYGIATWAPRSEWLRLWRPVEVKLIQEETPRPPEIKPLEEPAPPPPEPEVVARKNEPSPPPAVPVKVEPASPPPEAPPLPVMTAAPSEPAVETPAHTVQPQPEAPPTPPPANAVPNVEPSPVPAVPKTVTRVEYIRAPAPGYPLMSRRLGEQGTVMIKVLVDTSGRVVEAVVHQSSGKPRLDEAAKKAAMEALFKPHRETGKAETFHTVISISFTMRG